MQKNYTKIIIGIIFILLGFAFLTQTTGLLSSLGINIWILTIYIWPAILLFLGIKMLLKGNTMGGLILTALGLVFLLTHIFNWNFFGILWPVILISLGLSVFLKRDNSNINSSTGDDERDEFDETIAFWGLEKKFVSKAFKKGNVSIAFGGGKIDLREAKIDKKGAKLTLNVAFGGIEVLVPKDCKIISRGSGVFGGWENKVESKTTKFPTLEISGTAAFGAIEIKE